MKKLIIAALIILTVLAVGIVIFLSTFDVDRYRPFIVKQIETSLGKPVELKKISLGWLGGLALKMEGFSVFPSREQMTEPMATLDQLNAVVLLKPLLERKLQVGSIIIKKPQVKIIRNKQGVIEGSVPERKSQTEVPVKSNDASVAALSFIVQSADLRNGTVTYRDEMSVPVMEFDVKEIEADIRDIALDRPIPIRVQASFLSNQQNVIVAGNLLIASKQFVSTLRGFHLELDLESLQYPKMIQAFPFLKDAGLREGLSGKFIVELDDLELTPEGAQKFKARVLLEDGKLSMQTLRSPVEKIRAELEMTQNRILIKSFSCQLAGGGAGASGVINDFGTTPYGDLQLNASGINLAQLLPASGDSSQPNLEGILAANFNGTFKGTSEQAITASLLGTGNVILERGVVRNLNVVRTIFDRLSVIPGLVQRLRERLPKDYQEKIEARDTFLSPTNIPFKISNGILIANPIRISAETFAIEGGMNAYFNGAVSGNMILFVEPQLTAAMVRSVNELSYLTDAQGALAIPLSIQGTVPDIRILPNVQDIASRLAVSKTSEFLGNLMQKNRGQESTAQTTTSNPSGAGNQGQSENQTEEITPFSLLNQFLQTSQQKKNSQ